MTSKGTQKSAGLPLLPDLESTGLGWERDKAVSCSKAEAVSHLLSAGQAATSQCPTDKAAAQNCGGGTSA